MEICKFKKQLLSVVTFCVLHKNLDCKHKEAESAVFWKELFELFEVILLGPLAYWWLNDTRQQQNIFWLDMHVILSFHHWPWLS